MSLWGPWPGGSFSGARPPSDATTAWEASLDRIKTGRGDLVHRVGQRLGEAAVALGVVPACPLEDRPAVPPLLVRAASQGRVSVTLGFDGDPSALARLEARLEEVVR